MRPNTHLRIPACAQGIAHEILYFYILAAIIDARSRAYFKAFAPPGVDQHTPPEHLAIVMDLEYYIHARRQTRQPGTAQFLADLFQFGVPVGVSPRHRRVLKSDSGTSYLRSYHYSKQPKLATIVSNPPCTPPAVICVKLFKFACDMVHWTDLI